MKLLNKPFAEYVQMAKVGIGLLLVVSVVRFLLKPVFSVPYAQGTNFASVTILLPIIMLFYAIKIANSGGTYRDVLGVAMALCFSTAVFIIAGIALDHFGGIDTYYTDLEHGGSFNVWQHIGGHVVVSGIIFTLAMWGLGSLIYLIAGGSRKKAMA
jgi:hypothetical protein